MNMTIKFPDGSMSNIMQQEDGNYLVVLRRSGTYQVSMVRSNVSLATMGNYLTLAREVGATVKMEYVA